MGVGDDVQVGASTAGNRSPEMMSRPVVGTVVDDHDDAVAVQLMPATPIPIRSSSAAVQQITARICTAR